MLFTRTFYEALIGWQVTLCDPMWHVSSRIGVATLRTAIHLLLSCLLTVVLCLIYHLSNAKFFRSCQL